MIMKMCMFSKILLDQEDCVSRKSLVSFHIDFEQLR